MNDEFQSYVKSQQLFDASDNLLLAVSGGVDSMTLAHLLLTSGYRFQVAHVNFQLRGEASEGDEELVRSFCSAHNIPFHTKKVDTHQWMQEKGVSVQMAARDLRHSWFESLRLEQSCDYVLTAHNADDNIETALFNLVKGTGIQGLVGIRPKKGAYRRPLLFAQKHEIVAFAKEKGLQWREDASNSEVKYLRNKLRHEVVPILREINPSVVTHFEYTQERLLGVEQLLMESVEQLKRNYLEEGLQGLELRVDWVHQDPQSLVQLAAILSDFSFSFRQSRQVFESLKGQSGKFFESATHRVNLDRNRLLISDKEASFSAGPPVMIAEGDAEVVAAGLQLRLSKGNRTAIDWSSVGPLEAFIDSEKLVFPLRIRAWERGDTFCPLGMGGQKKKVSDFFIDQKLSIMEKEQVYVLESNGQIVWLIGYRLDDRFKITEATRSMIKISASFT